ncbi:MAG: transposase, partial [Candidatus Binatia bacterium]
GAMPRQARLDSPGTLHHVIIRGIERRRIVDDQQDRENFVSRLGKLATESRTSIYAWALMSNHAHLLLSSGPKGLANFMRRFMTGYAVSYNVRHRRYGHLFQNRYKSIVCDTESYFAELVRYIHLNPLRVKLVGDLSELERYPYCGHGAVLGRLRYQWQDRDSVLQWFGKREGEAKRAYRRFVGEGAGMGRRPELVGGGLIRSLGGWSGVVSLRRRGVRALTDERILGSGDFVEGVLKEADERLRQRYWHKPSKKPIEQWVADVCKRRNVSVAELLSGSRRGSIPGVRAEIAGKFVEDYGISLAEAARQLGVSTSAISKMIQKSYSR